MRTTTLSALLVVLCGGLGGWLVWQLVPRGFGGGIPGLYARDYRLERSAADAFEISDAKWFPVPFLFADFDLHLDVELGEAMDLDLLVRQVEPRAIGSETIPFHGRFTVLRLSTRGADRAWLTRDEALFGASRGGADLAPGLVATVWVQGRGRMLRANVAGKWLPWCEADDEYGMFTLIARGGKAALRNFVVENHGQRRAWLWSRWLWIGIGLAAGCGWGIVVGMAGVARWRAVCFGACALVLVVYPLMRHGPGAPLSLPSPPLLALSFAAPTVLALALLLTGWRQVVVVSVTMVVWSGYSAAFRAECCRRDGALEAVFGPASGSTPSEALAQRVRGEFQIHVRGEQQHRVFLLGGQLLYGRGAREQHLEPLLAGDLRVAKQHEVDVPCLPTVDGHCAQQWRLFAQFFAGYRPHVIVFGVPRDEAAEDPATGRPRSDAGTVERTLQAAREHCRAHGAELVLFADAGLDEPLLAVLRQAARDGLPLVEVQAGEEPAALSRRLAAAIAPRLR